MERYLPDEEQKIGGNRFVYIDNEQIVNNESNMSSYIINFNNTPEDEDDSDFYDEDDDFKENDDTSSKKDNLIEIDVKVGNTNDTVLNSLDDEDEFDEDFEDEDDEFDEDFDDEEENIKEDEVINIDDNSNVKEVEEITNTNKSNLIDTEEDIKVNIFKMLSEYFPMTMRLDKNSGKEVSTTKKGIVIEKLGEEIIAVENLGFIPFYVKGEKENLIVRENNLTNYIEWLKNDVIKRYNNGITIEEFDKIEKLIIVENESEMVELNSNETYINRTEALDRLAQKYDVVIDLTMNNCHIKFNDNNVSCSIDVEGLGYKIASSTDWAEEISTKLSCFKNRNIIFLGIAGNEKLLKELSEKFNIAPKRNFESLAWEML